MKKFKHTQHYLLLLLLLLSFKSQAEPVAVSGVTLSATDTLFVGDTLHLPVVFIPVDATNKAVTWKSGKFAIATVDTITGKITAKAPGNVNIRVTTVDGGYTAVCQVTVIPVAVTEVTLNRDTATLIVGSNLQLTAAVLPINATKDSVAWSSSNIDVATVNTTGKITAAGPGTANIIVKATDGSNKKDTCVVTVKQLVTSVTLNVAIDTLIVGSNLQLTAAVLPSNATNDSVAWSSSNIDVATVNTTGKITAVGPGTANIIVKTTDGSNKKDTCVITVKIPVTSVGFNPTIVTLVTGDTLLLLADISPSNATNKKVTWTSNNAAVATVDGTGKIKAIALGSTTITVTTIDGNKTATCTVTVIAPIAVTSVTLRDTATLNFGDSLTLVATLLPTTATNKKVTWSSSHPAIATVDTTGKIKATGQGIANIIVTTADGGKMDTCMVTVNPAIIAVTGVALNLTTDTLNVGDTLRLVATVIPSNAANKKVSWSSSDPAIVTVDITGKIKAVAPGLVAITVKTVDRNESATCIITVNASVVAVTGVVLNITTDTLNIGDTLQLKETVNPNSATNKKVTWSSSNPAIATVDTTGKIKAIALGTAAITVKTIDGNKTDTCTVTVANVPVVSATGVTLDITTVTLITGNDLQLAPTVSPNSATNKKVTWSSNNTAVATVDSTGKITAITPGTAAITVKTIDGNKTDTCVVQVKYPTGIDNTQQNQFKVYPSVTTNVINISAPVGSFIHIFDTAGTPVYSTVTRSEESQIDLSGYQNGIYIVKSKFGTAKVIKK